jgi:hypothetical protein
LGGAQTDEHIQKNRKQSSFIIKTALYCIIVYNHVCTTAEQLLRFVFEFDSNCLSVVLLLQSDLFCLALNAHILKTVPISCFETCKYAHLIANAVREGRWRVRRTHERLAQAKQVGVVDSKRGVCHLRCTQVAQLRYNTGTQCVTGGIGYAPRARTWSKCLLTTIICLCTTTSSMFKHSMN